MTEDFRTLYERHVQYVLRGDVKSAMADMVPERIPAVFEGVTVPRGQVDDLRIVDVRRDGDTWVGETIYETPGGPIGLRSIWILRDGAWKANALENMLLVQRCRTCETWLWGPRRICPSCFGFSIAAEAVDARGTVFSWCRTHHPYVEDLDLPYTTVLAALPAAGDVRVLGLLDPSSEPPKIGDPVVGQVNGDAVRWSVVA